MKTKISLVGDIMCEPYLIRAAKERGGYNFRNAFQDVSTLLKKSDLVIGNLETPLAGEEAKYCEELYSFNAPDEFAEALKRIGISFVSTANNHCLDRGTKGLDRTLMILDEKQIGHTGTYINEYSEKIGCIEVNGLKVSVVSCTYGTNWSMNHAELPENRRGAINLIQPQKALSHTGTQKKDFSFKRLVKRTISKPLRMAGMKEWKIEQLNKLFRTEVSPSFSDDSFDKQAIDEYFDCVLKKQLEEARNNSDFVILYPHVGGQFNNKPGELTKYFIGKATQSGLCDIVVASHPHVVQKAELVNGIPCFFSIGNFSMSPNSFYIPNDVDTDIGLVVHLYFDDSKLDKITFSFLGIEESPHSMMNVFHITGEKKTIQRAMEIYWAKAERAFKIVREDAAEERFVIQDEYTLNA